MIRKKFFKISYLLILSIILLNAFNPIYVNSANSLKTGKVDSNTMFSSDYSFTPKFITGVTTTTSYGMTNYKVDLNRSDSMIMTSEKYYSARLTSNSQKGNIWVRYNNVGTLNGQIIDLKITLADWSYLQPANLSANDKLGGVSYPTILFNKTAIDVNITSYPAVDSPVYKFTFYRNGTNETISIKSHITFKDIDGGSNGENEEIIFNSGFDSIFSSKASYIEFKSNHCINNLPTDTSNINKNAWVTCLSNGNSLSFTYRRNKDTVGNQYRDITKTASGTTRNFYHFLIGSESLAPFEFTNPLKEENKEKLRGLEELTYTISQFIPSESDDYYYTSYVLTDQIATCFDIEAITVSDDTKKDRTSWFDVLQDENNLVCISAKKDTLNNSDFYNNNFYFHITVKKKADKFLTQWYSENKNMFTVPNTANIEISSPTASGTRNKKLPTNTVEVVINQELKLPPAGGNGDILFIITGIIFISISIFLNFKKNNKKVSEHIIED